MEGTTTHGQPPSSGPERTFSTSPEGSADLVITQEGIQLTEGFAARIRNTLRHPKLAALSRQMEDPDAQPITLRFPSSEPLELRVKDLDGTIHKIAGITSMRLATIFTEIFASDIMAGATPAALPDSLRGNAATETDTPEQPDMPVASRPTVHPPASTSVAANDALSRIYTTAAKKKEGKPKEAIELKERAPTAPEEEAALRALVEIAGKQQQSGIRPGTWAMQMVEKLAEAKNATAFADAFYNTIGLKSGQVLIHFCQRIVDTRTKDIAGPADTVEAARPLAQRIIEEYDAMMKQMTGDETGGYGRALELEEIAGKFDSDNRTVRRAGLQKAPVVAGHHLSLLRPRLTQEPERVAAVAALMERGLSLPEFDSLSRQERLQYEEVTADARRCAHRARISDKSDYSLRGDDTVAARRGKIKG